MTHARVQADGAGSGPGGGRCPGFSRILACPARARSRVAGSRFRPELILDAVVIRPAARWAAEPFKSRCSIGRKLDVEKTRSELPLPVLFDCLYRTERSSWTHRSAASSAAGLPPSGVRTAHHPRPGTRHGFAREASRAGTNASGQGVDAPLLRAAARSWLKVNARHKLARRPRVVGHGRRQVGSQPALGARSR